MSLYPGDSYRFVLSITKADGSTPSVTSPPTISVVRLSDNAVLVSNASMNPVPGTEIVYTYVWNSSGQGNGHYLAVVSYAADGVTVTNRLLEAVRLGDSRITGVVALESTAAKDATVAKDVTTLKSSEYVSPDASPIVQSIKSKVDLLPADPATETTLSILDTKLEDIHDEVVGRWSVDKASQTLTLFRKNGMVLKSFNLISNSAVSERVPV